jgi:hypothetical protein
VSLALPVSVCEVKYLRHIPLANSDHYVPFAEVTVKETQRTGRQGQRQAQGIEAKPSFVEAILSQMRIALPKPEPQERMFPLDV